MPHFNAMSLNFLASSSDKGEGTTQCVWLPFCHQWQDDRENGNQGIRPNMASKHREELLVSRTVLNAVVQGRRSEGPATVFYCPESKVCKERWRPTPLQRLLHQRIFTKHSCSVSWTEVSRHWDWTLQDLSQFTQKIKVKWVVSEFHIFCLLFYKSHQNGVSSIKIFFLL